MKIKVLAIFACLSLLVSCGDKWLEAIGPADGTIAPPEMIFESETGVNNAMTGVYELIRTYYYDRDVTYGFKDAQLGYEYMGNDMVPHPSQWWTYEAAWNRLISSTNGYQTAFLWNMYSKIINNANGVIKGVTESKTLTEDFKKRTIAEAEAVRGWALFQFSRPYSLGYTQINPATTLCVPIYNTVTTLSTPGAPRSTVAKVFEQILKDLSDANIAQMRPAPFPDIYRANQNVAYAWRAQIKLEMGLWQDAASDAAKARAGFPLMSEKDYADGFNRINAEWIWAGPFKDDQATGYASFFSFADMTDGGYQTFFANSDYVKLFSDTDCRNLFEFWGEPGEPQWYDYASMKYKMQKGSFMLGDYVYIRAAEMLLIEAEGKARTGNEADAHNLLYELQKQRDPEAVKSSTAGAALIEEILVERRKELYGEAGVEYLDLRRLGRAMVRSGNHPQKNVTAAANDAKVWLFQIPRAEMDNNPNIKESDQNSRI